MKAKEEILSKTFTGSLSNKHYREVLLAMEEYASQSKPVPTQEEVEDILWEFESDLKGLSLDDEKSEIRKTAIAAIIKLFTNTETDHGK